MSMTFDEILESGLLELYVLGKLSEEEIQQVESAIIEYPQLKKHIAEIENSLFKYDKVLGVKPPNQTLDNILSQIEDSKPENNTQTNSRNRLSWLLGLLLVASFFLFLTKLNELNETIDNNNIVIQECEDDKTRLSQELALQTELLNYATDKYRIEATEKYPETELIIHSNPETKRNYLQIKNLPPLASNQSFQLWSLKGDTAPIPLDVFELNTGQIFEIQFEEGTNAYAITIEPRGGQDSPTLENLIGVFALGS